jgi:hypothetical protein
MRLQTKTKGHASLSCFGFRIFHDFMGQARLGTLDQSTILNYASWVERLIILMV